MCHLQELYAKFGDKGLVVLGINTADAKDVAVEMLDANHVEFPNILDTRNEANVTMAQYETLGGMSAVPMTYVIDRQGKVVDAWYGYEPGKAQRVAGKLLESND